MGEGREGPERPEGRSSVCRASELRVLKVQCPSCRTLVYATHCSSLRKRLAVSSFRRRRRLRRWRSSPISRSPLRPNQRLPEPSRPTHPNSATPGRLRPSAASAGGATTTENGREAAERDRKSAAASGGSPQAPAGTLHTQIWARPTHPRSCWSRVTDPARLRPTGTQSDACGRAGGRWVGGRLGSRSHGQPGRVCHRPAVARGRGQARAGERAATGRAPPGERRLRP